VSWDNGGTGILLTGGAAEVQFATSAGNAGFGIARTGSHTGPVRSSISWANGGGNFSGFTAADVFRSVGGFETACDNGLDDDEDGRADCDDDDCFTARCADPNDDWPGSWTEFEWGVLEETNRYRQMGASCAGDAHCACPMRGASTSGNGAPKRSRATSCAVRCPSSA